MDGESEEEGSRSSATMAERRTAPRRCVVNRPYSVLNCLADLVQVVGILLRDDFLDFETQHAKQLVFGIRADELAGAINRALAFSAGNTDVGHLRLTGAVDDAAHHRDFDRSLVRFRDRFDGAAELEYRDFGAPARRAGGNLKAFFTQA